MECQSFLPSLALRPFVERYCLIKHSKGRLELMPPGGFSGLMLNLGDAFHVETANGLAELPRCGLGGQLTQVMHLNAPPQADVLLIMFRPTGINRAFRLSMPIITNRIVDVDEVVNWTHRRDWYELPERLADMASSAQRVRLVDEQLLRLFARSGSATTWIDEALDQLKHRPTDSTVGQLSANLHVSQRQLTRRFTEEIGVSPKTYARIMRFRNLFQSVLMRPQRRWHDLIHEGGWYDQAHFIKDLHFFTGQTPSAFFAQYHATADFLLND